MDKRVHFTLIICLSVFLLLAVSIDAESAPDMMRVPGPSKKPVEQDILETSSAKLVLKGAIRLFQKRISPIDGPRCGFHPTCSSFGLSAIDQKGPVVGVMMTTDRLIRCNPWKRAGGHYEILPSGKSIDKVRDNELFN